MIRKVSDYPNNQYEKIKIQNKLSFKGKGKTNVVLQHEGLVQRESMATEKNTK